MSSQIFGNYIAAKVLGEISQTAYIGLMTLITLAFSCLFICLKPPIKVSRDSKKIEDAIIEMVIDENAQTDDDEESAKKRIH